MASVVLYNLVAGLFAEGAALAGSHWAVQGLVYGSALAAGSYIDMEIASALQGSQRQSAADAIGKQESIRVQTANEGAPVPFVQGSRIRCAGNIIWVGEIEEVVENSRGYKEYVYYTDVAIAICEAPVNAITKIYASGKIFYDSASPDSGTSNYTSLNFHLDGSNTPSSVIESVEGIGNVPRYKGVAYVVIERLRLYDFGNLIPTFNFEVQPSATPITAAQAVTGVWERAGLDTALIDTTAITSIPFIGGISNDKSGSRQYLSQMMAGHNFSVKEGQGKFTFIPITDYQSFEISTALLGATEASEKEKAPLFSVTDTPEVDLPSEYAVTYADTTADLQSGQQSIRKHSFVLENRQEAGFTFSMEPAQARKVAAVHLWQLWNNRQAIDLVLPANVLGLETHDILSFTYNTVPFKVRISKIERGFNLLHRITGHIEALSSNVIPPGFFIDVPADDSNIPDNSMYEIPELYAFHINDSFALTDDSAADAVVQIARSPATYGEKWLGGETHIYQKQYHSPLRSLSSEPPGTVTESVSDGGLKLSSTESALITDRDAPQTIGNADTALADAPSAYWDEKSTLEVTLYSGTLSSSTKTDIENDNKINQAIVGYEVINFREVTVLDIATNKYRLSGFLRGRRGTGYATGLHSADERFVLTDTLISVSASGERARVATDIVSYAHGGWEDYRTNNTYRVLGFDATSSQYRYGVENGSATEYQRGYDNNWQYALMGSSALEEHTRFGDNLLAFPPGSIRFVHRNNDMIIAWNRCTRYTFDLFGTTIAPVDEPREIYQIHILDASGTFVRELGGDVNITNYATSNSGWTNTTPDLIVKGVEDANVVTYTTADQLTDWGVDAKKSGFQIRVRQWSNMAKLGKAEQGPKLYFRWGRPGYGVF